MKLQIFVVCKNVTTPSSQNYQYIDDKDADKFRFDPDEMTPEERLDRIIELLALASVRLATEQSRPIEPSKEEKIPLGFSAERR